MTRKRRVEVCDEEGGDSRREGEGWRFVTGGRWRFTTKVGVHDEGYDPTTTIQPNSMDMATMIIWPNEDNATHGDGTAPPISSSTTA